MGGDGADGANFVSLFTVFLIVCAFMYVVIVGAFLIALWRARRPAEPLTVEEGKHRESRRWSGRTAHRLGASSPIGLSDPDHRQLLHRPIECASWRIRR